MTNILTKVLFIAVLLPWFATAEESGFLEDYSILGPRGEYGNARVYVAKGTIEKMAEYDKLMIDQPWIFIDPDSNSKGMKPESMTVIAETLRAAVSQSVNEFEQYEVVEKEGPGVVYFRWAITNMYLQKPRRRLLGYTPVGVVVHAAKSGMSDFIDKNSLVDLRLEGEMLDSQTGEVLFAMTLSRGQRKDKESKLREEPADWDELFAIGTALGKRLGCRMNNARVMLPERKDCTAIRLGEDN